MSVSSLNEKRVEKQAPPTNGYIVLLRDKNCKKGYWIAGAYWDYDTAYLIAKKNGGAEIRTFQLGNSP